MWDGTFAGDAPTSVRVIGNYTADSRGMARGAPKGAALCLSISKPNRPQ